MKRNLLLSCCIALLAVGCNCFDCKNVGISVSPPALLLSYSWDMDFPDDYTSEEAGAILRSSHNWKISAYDQSRIQLSHIDLSGTGGVFHFKVSYTEAFMQVIQEELIPAMKSGTPLKKFPYNSTIDGYKITTVIFTSDEGQTASLSVYYPAYVPPTPTITLWTGDDITLVDKSYLFKTPGVIASPAPNFEFTGGKIIPTGSGALAFGVTLTAEMDSYINIGGMSFVLNNSIKTKLMAHLEDTWDAYETQRQHYNNNGYGSDVDIAFFQAYSTKEAYIGAATALLEQSSLLKLNVDRNQNQAEFHFSFDQELMLLYPTIDIPNSYPSYYDNYYDFCPVVSIIDIIRNIITDPDATIGVYTLELSHGNELLLRKAYNVKIEGKLWVTQQDKIDASPIAEITLTKDNYHLYLNNSFDGEISVEVIPFDFKIDGVDFRLDPADAIRNSCSGGYSFRFGNHVFWVTYSGRGGFQLEYLEQYVGAWTLPLRWWHTPQLLMKHRIDLSDSCFAYMVAGLPNNDIFWDISGKGLPIGNIRYTDTTGVTRMVNVYLGMTASELREFLQ